MTDLIFISIILIHFLADFAMQTDWQAQNKSKHNEALTWHVSVYTLIWFIFLLQYGLAKAFVAATFICISHWITDYCTSRINKSFFDKRDLHNGFVGVGFDQMLHYLQLYYIFKYIIL